MLKSSVDDILKMKYENWDRNAVFYSADEDSPLMRVLAMQRKDFCKLKPGQRVLDIGCGTGGTVAELSKKTTKLGEKPIG